MNHAGSKGGDDRRVHVEVPSGTRIIRIDIRALGQGKGAANAGDATI